MDGFFQEYCELYRQVTGKTDNGLNALLNAASVGLVKIGRCLINEHKVNVNATSYTSARDTALTIASAKGHVEFVKLLLENGAKVNLKTSDWNSPLWLAANGGHLEVAELLYKAEADIGSENKKKVSCLLAAFHNGHVNVVEWMVEKVTHFPSDKDMKDFISEVGDKNLLEKCNQCMQIISEARLQAEIRFGDLIAEWDSEEPKPAAAARRPGNKKPKKQVGKLKVTRAANTIASSTKPAQMIPASITKGKPNKYEIF